MIYWAIVLVYEAGIVISALEEYELNRKMYELNWQRRAKFVMKTVETVLLIAGLAVWIQDLASDCAIIWERWIA